MKYAPRPAGLKSKDLNSLTSDPLLRPAADLYRSDVGKFMKSILK